jgi:hypothetical protein
LVSGNQFWFGSQIRRCRIDDKPILYGCAAKQHPETHRITVRKRNLDRPGFVTEGDGCFDDESLLAVATRVGNKSFIEYVRRTNALTIGTFLQRMDSEAYALFAAELEWFEKKSV